MTVLKLTADQTLGVSLGLNPPKLQHRAPHVLYDTSLMFHFFCSMYADSEQECLP